MIKATNKEVAQEQIEVIDGSEDGSDAGVSIFGVSIIGQCDVKELRRAFEQFLDDRDRQ